MAGAVELQKELASTTGFELTSTFVFDYPTMAEMVSFILQSIPPELETNPAEAARLSETSGGSGFARDPTGVAAQSSLLMMDNAARRQHIDSQVSQRLSLVKMKHRILGHAFLRICL